MTAGSGRAGKNEVELGQVQETLFIPLVGRAEETRKRRPLLRDPKAVEILESVGFDWSKYSRTGGWTTVLRVRDLRYMGKEFPG